MKSLALGILLAISPAANSGEFCGTLESIQIKSTTTLTTKRTTRLLIDEKRFEIKGMNREILSLALEALQSDRLETCYDGGKSYFKLSFRRRTPNLLD